MSNYDISINSFVLPENAAKMNIKTHILKKRVFINDHMLNHNTMPAVSHGWMENFFQVQYGHPSIDV